MRSIDKINILLTKAGMSGAELGRSIGVSRAVYSQWNSGETKPSRKSLKKVADVLKVDVTDIMDDDMFSTQKIPDSSPSVADAFVSFPVIGDVAAGYDHIAYEDWTGDSLDVPKSWLHGRPASDYFVLRVKGDSMYPDYQDGDHVLILRQSTMDRSGQVGIVRYNGEAATLKRIEYVMGENWMIMRPINPQYPPITIRNADLEQCTVFGVAKMVIRELNQ